MIQIINTEWGAFSNGLPLTVFDRDMDAASINPGEQVSCSFCRQCQFTFDGASEIQTKLSSVVYISWTDI